MIIPSELIGLMFLAILIAAPLLFTLFDIGTTLWNKFYHPMD